MKRLKNNKIKFKHALNLGLSKLVSADIVVMMLWLA